MQLYPKSILYRYILTNTIHSSEIRGFLIDKMTEQNSFKFVMFFGIWKPIFFFISYFKNYANFGAFYKVISSSINLSYISKDWRVYYYN